jgi:hypothetical protein
MPLAPLNSLGVALNCRLAVKGIQWALRSISLRKAVVFIFLFAFDAAKIGCATLQGYSTIPKNQRASRSVVRSTPIPFGGVKNSGAGRDGGHRFFDFYMETKNIAISTARHNIPKLGG